MNRTYVVFSTSETGSVDFSQVLETSNETLRLSIDGSKTFVKYEGDMPSSITSLTTYSGSYSHSEILGLLSTDEWTDPNPPNQEI
jgi:hypothetical protein